MPGAPCVMVDWRDTLEVQDSVSAENANALEQLLEKSSVVVCYFVGPTERQQQVSKQICEILAILQCRGKGLLLLDPHWKAWEGVDCPALWGGYHHP